MKASEQNHIKCQDWVSTWKTMNSSTRLTNSGRKCCCTCNHALVCCAAQGVTHLAVLPSLDVLVTRNGVLLLVKHHLQHQGNIASIPAAAALSCHVILVTTCSNSWAHGCRSLCRSDANT